MKKNQTSIRAGVVMCMLAVMAISAQLVSAQSAQQPKASKSGLAVSFQNLSLTHDPVRAKAAKATDVAANDTLRFSLVFTNNEGRTLNNVVFDNPMPAHMQLIGATVTTSLPAKVEYSIDGGVTYSAQPMVSILDGGRTIQRPAIPQSYTNIRWTVAGDVASGARVTAQFDTRVAERPSPRPGTQQP